MTTKVLARRILQGVLKHRRLPAGDCCAGQGCPLCGEQQLEKVEAYIQAGEPIRFALPGFPAKSSNRGKVLGPLPDFAEHLALQFLQGICDDIAGVYDPGARIIVCSDGHVFSDLVGVPDEDVSQYSEQLREMCGETGVDSVDLFGLEDEYPGLSFDHRRQCLVRAYGEQLTALQERIRQGAPEQRTFNGIARFLMEDIAALEPNRSRNWVRNTCKELAYHMVQRSAAWGRLVETRFPDAVRLSIHPQPCGSSKLGIYLVEAHDDWLTPWHGVAVDVGNGFQLMKRHQAEALGAQLIYRHGRPSHFAVSGRTLEQETATCLLEAN